MSTPNIPIVNKGLLYVNGFAVSQGAITVANLATAVINVAGGQCRDSTDTNDIILPNATYALNPLISGQVNALDVGDLAAAVTLYYVYAIADSTQYRTPGTLLSLADNIVATPTLPFGYDMYRRVGTVLSNAAGTGILSFHQRGNGSGRDTWWNVPIATALAAGNAVVLTSFNWSNATPTPIVPLTAGKVFAKVALTADAGGTRTCVFDADGSVTIANAATVGEVIISSPASTVTTASLQIPCTPGAGPVLPMTSFYAVSNAAAAVAVLVHGFVDLL
jgi:hypothetical protein